MTQETKTTGNVSKIVEEVVGTKNPWGIMAILGFSPYEEDAQGDEDGTQEWKNYNIGERDVTIAYLTFAYKGPKWHVTIFGIEDGTFEWEVEE